MSAFASPTLIAFLFEQGAASSTRMLGRVAASTGRTVFPVKHGVNVRALVDSGAPQASKVLVSPIAYLRAAVPRMHAQTNFVKTELELARAHRSRQMRIPDQLQYSLHLDPGTAGLQCPPMTLLTQVETAVRHGIDPSGAGGRSHDQQSDGQR